MSCDSLYNQSILFFDEKHKDKSNLENKWCITHIHDGKVHLINSDKKTILKDIPKWYLVEYFFIKN
tara:strand:+ start:183 stop:380 length:198 start_codon:yes stop_codon:yes gene_type:complete